MTRVWFGNAGHFIGAADCRFHLHTHVAGLCVSTVGDYRPRSASDAPTMIGSGRFYETMVFRLDGDDVTDHNELDFAAYNERDEANAGHDRMLRHVESGGISAEVQP